MSNKSIILSTNRTNMVHRRSDLINHAPLQEATINENANTPKMTMNMEQDQCLIDQLIPHLNVYLTTLALDKSNLSSEVPALRRFTHIIQIDGDENDCLNHWPEAKILHLDYGNTTFPTPVLPNCYKAVRFIETTLKSNGSILVVDRNGNQKYISIVVSYIMYKYNKTFADAFQIVKRFSPSTELDVFLRIQLYEYEPILQVQKAQSRGHSCSSELRRMNLKRKKPNANDSLSANCSTSSEDAIME